MNRIQANLALCIPVIALCQCSQSGWIEIRDETEIRTHLREGFGIEIDGGSELFAAKKVRDAGLWLVRLNLTEGEEGSDPFEGYGASEEVLTKPRYVMKTAYREFEWWRLDGTEEWQVRFIDGRGEGTRSKITIIEPHPSTGHYLLRVYVPRVE